MSGNDCNNRIAVVIVGFQGPEGAPGVAGPAGPMGAGIPPGGLKGYVLAKLSDDDYDYIWVDPAHIVSSDSLLLENSSYMLQEDGISRLLLEGQAIAGLLLQEDGVSHFLLADGVTRILLEG
jgi:hypothetical protein